MFTLLISFVLYLREKNSRFITLINKIPGPKPVMFFGNLLPFYKIKKEGESEIVSIFTSKYYFKKLRYSFHYLDWFLCGCKIIQEFAYAPLSTFWLGSKVVINVHHASAIEVIMDDAKPKIKLIHVFL